MSLSRLSAVVGVLASLALAGGASAQLRVCTYNVTNYDGGREQALQTVLYGQYKGRSLRLDVLAAQEVLSQAAVDALLDVLNTAPGSPGDWAAAPFVDGPDSDSALFYRTGKASLLGVTVVSQGGSDDNQHPRNVMRYDLAPTGYASAPATIAVYVTHMKAGDGTLDQQRRLVEAQAIRDDAENLPQGWNFVLAGDLNTQRSTQPAYIELVGEQNNDLGRFFDPIGTPGTWNNNEAFRFVHTQDPVGAGGMDDRHDQILVSASLGDREAADYIGEFGEPYSSQTWNDLNHSYRAWGNDGSSFNQQLRTVGNEMVGRAIAEAIIEVADNGGHLPVYLDLQVPARVGSASILDFGTVPENSDARLNIIISNAGDVGLWTEAGIDELDYTLQATEGFGAPEGEFTDEAGGGGISHEITMDTSTPGPVEGELLIFSDDPEEPVRRVQLTGRVGDACRVDLDNNGSVDGGDFLAFLSLFFSGNPRADFTGDGRVDGGDFLTFLSEFFAGC